MALESLDIRRRSASQTSPPDVRKHTEVAKLIDISRCIGCKACQVACMEWNDVRDDVGVLETRLHGHKFVRELPAADQSAPASAGAAGARSEPKASEVNQS